MAAITDPIAIAFANRNIRPIADAMASLYEACKITQLDWSAKGISSLIPNTSDVLVDGASVNGTDGTGGDGRVVIAGSDVNQIMFRISELVTDYEANNKTKLLSIHGVNVNVRPIIQG